jgi:adenylate cyclase
LINPRIEADGGRIVKTTGDGVLVEFPSAVDAVRNALAINAAMAGRDANLPEDRRIQFRVGINVGDVIVEGDDIHGDGVNVASRLEGLCGPGEVYVSGTVYDQAAGKLAASFEALGEQKVKNIAKPVRVYRTWAQSEEVAKMAEPLPFPDKPSIAVLPFENMSGDPEQEYFSDGIAEDIITALSRIRQLFVIARNTTFTYKGQAVAVLAVAKDLGVRYVLEGSVRKAGNRVRITAQLIDGSTGNHLWAERYDRKLEDIFALQDEITETVVGAIEPEVSRAEQQRARLVRPENLGTWEICQHATGNLQQRTLPSLAEAERLFQEAIDREPDFSPAHIGLAETYHYLALIGGPGSSKKYREPTLREARRAVDLDVTDAAAHCALGRAHHTRREHDAAIPELEMAIRLNPSYAWAVYSLGMALAHSGRPEAAIPHLRTAIRLSPRDRYLSSFYARMSESLLLLGQFEEAADWGLRAVNQAAVTWPHYASLISALGHLGRTGEAKAEIDALNEIREGVTVSYVREHHTMTGKALSTLIDGLDKAGLPE